jgi:hypothetical protein
MMKKPIWRVLRGALLALIIVAVFAVSATPAKAAGWDYDLFVYLWASGLDGTMTVRDREADLDVPFSDIFDNLDLAFATHFEANQRDGKWGWFFDLFYADLGKDFDKVTGSFDQKMTYIEGAVAYNTSRDFQLFVGVRYTSLDLTLKFNPEIPLPPEIQTRVDGSQSWYDLMTGLRWRKELGKRWGLSARGDVAGFGISDSSDFTWNVVLMAQVNVSARWGILFGYRWLDIDYVNEKDEFAMDVRQAGPVFAIGYAFH